MQQPVLAEQSISSDVKMRASIVLLAAIVTVAYAAGQFYVPRAYYTIDSEGHETAPVPLRRLRRSLSPYPYANANANADVRANANAHGDGGRANANANAKANANANAVGSGGWTHPGLLGSSNSQPLKPGMTRSQSGTLTSGDSVSASISQEVSLGSDGHGFYKQAVSVGQ